MQSKTVYYNTKHFGWLKLTLDASEKVTAAVFTNRAGSDTDVPKKIKDALDAYCTSGTNLPKQLYRFPSDGTDFMHDIWKVIASVPCGKTITYTELAQKAGRPNAVRASGTACGKNPLALFIPCHRVVRTHGEDFGYAWGPDRKRALLKYEGAL